MAWTCSEEKEAEVGSGRQQSEEEQVVEGAEDEEVAEMLFTSSQ